jgi:KDO2-lipid IV(A) lauroyltransferase
MSYIPFPLGQFLGKMLSVPFSLLPLKRMDISLNNIQQSYGGSMDRDKAKRLNRRVIRNFGQMIFEAPHTMRINRDNLDRYVHIVNGENFHNALKKGKGAFILSAHFGNWELMSAAIPLYFGGVAAVVRPFDFQPLDRLVNELRSRYGSVVIPKQKAMRKILMSLRQNKAVGILLDQNVDWYDGVFVKFLGRWACTNKGLALLAMKTGAPVIPTFAVKQADGRYRLIFEKEVRLIDTGDKTRDVEENTALFTGILEKYIRRYPDHWFWFHMRWKTLPYCKLPADYYTS